jgi:uncharacterized membrane protein
MNRGIGLISGLGLGAGLGVGLMYFLDPQTGRRRRALLRDQADRLVRRAGEAARVAGRDLAYRARGALAGTRSMVAEGEVDDRTLEERVRSKIGRYVSHPGSIEVSARGGRITLNGPVLAREVDWLLDRVASVPGVKGVENRLEVHQRAEDVPGSQGGGRRPGERPDLLQANWSPATRAVAVTAGGALLAFGATRRFPVACALGSVGLALAARGLTNKSLGQLVGVSGGRRAVDIQKTITIAGPPERVFPLWANYQNFPRFMRNLRAVRDLGNGRSHWEAAGPAGVPVTWDAVITRLEPNQVIAWRSEPGSTIANAGVIRFEPTPDGNTRVNILLSYNPPGGALGHFAAQLFGADARSEMDEDLVRLKSLIEQGETSAPGKGRVARQEVAGQTQPTAPGGGR